MDDLTDLLLLPYSAMEVITRHLSSRTRDALRTALVGAPPSGSAAAISALRRAIAIRRLRVPPDELPLPATAEHVTHLTFSLGHRLERLLELPWEELQVATLDRPGSAGVQELMQVASRFPHLQALAAVSLQRGSVGDAIACVAQNLTQLTKLDLSEAGGWSPGLLQPLSELSGLRDLRLVGLAEEETPGARTCLSLLAQLTSLNLSFDMPDCGPMGELTALRDAKLQHTGKEEPDWECLGALTGLTALRCSARIVPGCSLPTLTALMGLVHVSVAGVKNGGLLRLCTMLPESVTALHVTGSFWQAGTAFAQADMAAVFPHLRQLYVNRPNVPAECTPDTLRFASMFPALQQLDIEGSALARAGQHMQPQWLRGMLHLEVANGNISGSYSTLDWQLLAGLPALRSINVPLLDLGEQDGFDTRDQCSQQGMGMFGLASWFSDDIGTAGGSLGSGGQQACIFACSRLTSMTVWGIKQALAPGPHRGCPSGPRRSPDGPPGVPMNSGRCVHWFESLIGSSLRMLLFHNTGKDPVKNMSFGRLLLPDAAIAALARWQSLQQLELGMCTVGQLQQLCASRTLTHIHVREIRAADGACLAATECKSVCQQLEQRHCHRQPELFITCGGRVTWTGQLQQLPGM